EEMERNVGRASTFASATVGDSFALVRRYSLNSAQTLLRSLQKHHQVSRSCYGHRGNGTQRVQSFDLRIGDCRRLFRSRPTIQLEFCRDLIEVSAKTSSGITKLLRPQRKWNATWAELRPSHR